jgi:hypothetical protein
MKITRNRSNKANLEARLKAVNKQLEKLQNEAKLVIDAYKTYVLSGGEIAEVARKLAPFWRVYYQKVWETPEASNFRRCKEAWLKGDLETVRQCAREARYRLEGETTTFMRKPSLFDPEWVKASWPVSCYLHLSRVKAQYEQELGMEPEEEDTYAAALTLWDQ